MRAAVFKTVETPLSFEDLPDPLPGPGQVRIKMHSSGLCGTDMHVFHGHFPVPLPIVFGHEPVGVIDALGPGVTTFSIGDRVGVSWVQGGCGRCVECARERTKYCRASRTWVQNGGGNAQLMIAEATGCNRIPEGIAWEVAAPMFCAGFTVMSGYRNARPRPGDRVAVIGMGGLGHLALQIAKALGHETIAITSSENKRAECKLLGADEVLVVKSHAGKELAALGGADVVLSTSNGMAQVSQVVSGLRPEGRLVSMSIGAGAIEADPMTILGGQLSIIGSMQNDRADLIEILDLVAAGKVKPMLEVYPFAKINEAIARLAAGDVRYRAVVQIQP
jgi:D-arabinose 1-dehydrogenase-like Zn-dependent alcohol dehydrogenase